MKGIKTAVLRFWLLALLFLPACQSAAAPATATLAPPTDVPDQPTPTAVTPTEGPNSGGQYLFLGDSFTVGLTEHIVQMAVSSEPPLMMEATEITHGGMTLYGHWFSPQTVPTIEEGNWTAVILQEDLALEGLDIQNFFEYARNFHEIITNSGAETILYMTWEYDNGNPMTIEEIASAYREMGTELGVKVAPVGLAWDRSRTERPELDLYGPDRSHSGFLGSFLSVNVLYATIFDQSPVGIPFLPDGITLEDFLEEEEAISEADLDFLQQLAWDTVVDYRTENE